MNAILDVALPVFGMVLCGYLAVRFRLLNQQNGDVLNGFVYLFAFPALLFVVVARTPLDQIFYWPFLLAWLASLGAIYVLTAVASVLIYGDGLASTGVRCMNSACSSTAFMGIPLSIYAFGKDAALPAILATTIIVTVFFSITLLMIEAGRGSQAEGKPTVKSIAISLSKNPLMLSVVAGAIASALRIKLPLPLVRFCEVLGGAAIPCSLIAMGVFIARYSVAKTLRGVGIPVFIKLVVHPLLAWVLVSMVFDLEPFWTKAAILLAALPTATSCFVIAQHHDVISAESSGTAWVSTLLSVVSVSVVLAVFHA